MVPADEDPKREVAQPAHSGPASDARSETGTEPSAVNEERVETPFDHPLFLPVVLFGLSLWFLWDGFIVPMEEHLLFNRGGFAVFALATLWFGYKGVQEMRAAREDSASAEDRDTP